MSPMPCAKASVQSSAGAWARGLTKLRWYSPFTHTHSGPDGCAHEALYNVVTPGFVPAHVDAIVVAATQSLLAARSSAAATTLVLADGAFDPAVAGGLEPLAGRL